MAADGEEALDLVLQERPDLLITDYQMPVMSGVELCQALHNDAATAGIPILMLTARGFDLSEAERDACGILELMSKPFSPAEVLQKAQDLIAKPVSQE
jgi:CheY-like chemotaxis protein